jgi:IclR family mhp operon transcriptional activator
MERSSDVRSISRSLSVLRAINRAGSLSMIEIAHTCRLPYPTARRITSTLMKEGMLEREPTRKNYRPTVLVKSLSHGYQDHSGLVDICRPHLTELTREHLWPVSLATRVGQMMVVRDCTHAMSPMAMHNYRAGAAFPLLECASGHIYLAYTDEDEREQLLKAATEAEFEADPQMVAQFRSGARVAEILETGYAIRGRNRFTNTPGRTSSIAAPVFNNGKVCAVLTMVLFASAMKVIEAADRYAPPLKAAAQRITAELEHMEESPSRAA